MLLYLFLNNVFVFLYGMLFMIEAMVKIEYSYEKIECL